jgi:hypothetical protein
LAVVDSEKFNIGKSLKKIGNDIKKAVVDPVVDKLTEEISSITKSVKTLAKIGDIKNVVNKDFEKWTTDAAKQTYAGLKTAIALA